MEFEFESSTLDKIIEFDEILKQVKIEYPNATMAMMREYLKNGTKVDGVPEEFYGYVEKLAKIRLEALDTEKECILAQAQKAGIKIPDSIFSGKNLIPYLDEEISQKIPTLTLVEKMKFYSIEEIARMTKKEENNKEENSSSER